LRDFLNDILSFISASSLTDEEWSTVSDLTDQSYTLANYSALSVILDAREAVSTTRNRLRYYFLARSVEIPESSTAKSNILLGSAL